MKKVASRVLVTTVLILSASIISVSALAPGEPDIFIETAPTKADVAAGGSVKITVTVYSAEGFEGNVKLESTNSPAGVTATFQPNPVNVPAFDKGTVTMTVNVATSVAQGKATLTITGTGVQDPKIKKTVGIELNILDRTPQIIGLTTDKLHYDPGEVAKIQGLLLINGIPAKGYTIRITLNDGSGLEVYSNTTLTDANGLFVHYVKLYTSWKSGLFTLGAQAIGPNAYSGTQFEVGVVWVTSTTTLSTVTTLTSTVTTTSIMTATTTVTTTTTSRTTTTATSTLTTTSTVASTTVYTSTTSTTQTVATTSTTTSTARSTEFFITTLSYTTISSITRVFNSTTTTTSSILVGVQEDNNLWSYSAIGVGITLAGLFVAIALSRRK